MNLIFKLFSRSEKRICPPWMCYTFDNPFRKLFQNPYRILFPYIKPGFTVADIGPGMGYYTIPLCNLTGPQGKVYAIDIQEKMLIKLRVRAKKARIPDNLITHLAKPDDFNLEIKADFVLAFWMVHETPDQSGFFKNVRAIIKPKAVFLVVEPKIHVTRKKFDNTLKLANNAGFKLLDSPKISLSYSALLSIE